MTFCLLFGHVFVKFIRKLHNQKKIQDLLEDGTYDSVSGKERLAEVENQITATKISVSEANIEKFDIEAALIYATNFIKNLGRQWIDLPPQLRPRFQKLVFPDGIPYSREKGFGTAKLGLIYEQIKRFDVKKSKDVCLLYQVRTYFQNK